MRLKKKTKKKNIFTYTHLLKMGLKDTKENRELHKRGEDLELLIRIEDEETNNE